MLSTTRFFRLATTAVALGGFVSGTAAGGSIRYELPNFLGEHVYDNDDYTSSSVYQEFELPYDFPTIAELRVVVEGTVRAGLAHGDGIHVEPLRFDLIPSVLIVLPGNFFHISGAETPETFQISAVRDHPFRPAPGMGNIWYPEGPPRDPLKFSVSLNVGLAFATYAQLPPRIGGISPPLFARDAFIVDVPIVATIERAYMILSGPTIVPEPSGVAVGMGLLLAGVAVRWRSRWL